MLSLFYSLLSVFIVSLLSFFGVFALSVNEDLLHKILFVLLGFSGGTILGAAFLDYFQKQLNLELFLI